MDSNLSLYGASKLKKCNHCEVVLTSKNLPRHMRRCIANNNRLMSGGGVADNSGQADDEDDDNDQEDDDEDTDEKESEDEEDDDDDTEEEDEDDETEEDDECTAIGSNTDRGRKRIIGGGNRSLDKRVKYLELKVDMLMRHAQSTALGH